MHIDLSKCVPITVPQQLKPTLTNVKTVADDASEAVNGSRQETYGHPYDDFSRTAKMWSGYLGIEVAPEDVANMQIIVKLSRLKNCPKHRDSLVDVVGYALCEEKIINYVK